MKKFIYITFMLLLLTACAAGGSRSGSENLPPPAAPAQATVLETADLPTVSSSPTDAAATPAAALPTESAPEASPTGSAGNAPAATTAPTPHPTLAPGEWQSLPVIPAGISARVRQVYQLGQLLGSRPQAFSKVGDCGSTPAWFLGDFDRGPRYYSLGEFSSLEGVIQYYQGSYGRTSLAAKSGYNASSVFTTLWSDSSQCNPNETPLACEYRVHRPSVALVALGTNDVWHQDVFEEKVRQIIEYSLQNGVIPILSTKADNLEGDGSINDTIARLAVEYEIPLWNYWAAVQQLPDAGLQPDGAHITWGPNQFDNPRAMSSGWAVRNLTALQTLDMIWKDLSTAP